MRHSAFLIFGSLVVLVACADGTGPRPVGPAAAIHIIEGQSQVDTVARALDHPLIVRVVDSADKPVVGQEINWVVVAGGGSLFVATGITNSDGQAQNHWTLGTSAADTQRVEARAVDPVTGAKLVFAEFRAIPKPDAPAALQPTDVPAVPPEVGSSLAVSARVTDQYANPVPDASVTWDVVGGGALDSMALTTDTGGMARARWTLGPRADTVQAVFVTIVGLLDSATVAVTPTPGLPAALAVRSGATTTAPDTAMAVQPSIQITDRFGNTLATSGVSVSVAVMGATLMGATSATAAEGVASFTNLAISAPAGSYTLTFSAVVGDSTRTVTHAAEVLAPTHPVAQVAVGYTLFCSRTPTSATFCAPRAGPIAEVAGQTFSSVVSGYSHSCALTTAGAAYCWGRADQGALGVGADSVSETPAAVAGGLTFVSLIAGFHYTCGLTSAGDAYCWGAIDGVAFAERTPAHVAGRTFSSLVAGGSHVCGTDSGSVYCWGRNDRGQVGDGTTTTRYTPTLATAIAGHEFTELSGGGYHMCGRTGTEVYCWGSNGNGEIGNGVSAGPTPVLTPSKVSGSAQYAKLASAATANGMCAITTSGSVRCWGSDGTRNLLVPTLVPGNLVFESVSSSSWQSCGITPAGQAFCWSGSATPARWTHP